jgi:urease accessory protein
LNGDSRARLCRLADLRLLQLADSALPIGSLAHSLGLETLVAHRMLTTRNLTDFLRGYLEEAGTLEAVFCRQAFRMAGPAQARFPAAMWTELNQRLSAWKPAREARTASITLGQNFVACVLALENIPVIREALDVSRSLSTSMLEIHHSTAFGLVCGALNFDEAQSIAAYLHQQLASLVSACQRLLPLGQTAAAKIMWDLKPTILEAPYRSLSYGPDDAYCFTPLLDWAAMEHAALSTRLFVS